jgi:hypothetical protein
MLSHVEMLSHASTKFIPRDLLDRHVDHPLLFDCQIDFRGVMMVRASRKFELDSIQLFSLPFESEVYGEFSNLSVWKWQHRTVKHILAVELLLTSVIFF